MGGNHAGAVDHLIPHIQRLAFCAGWIQVTGIPYAGSFPTRRQSRRRFRWRAGPSVYPPNIRFISLNAVDENSVLAGLKRKFSRMRISGSSTPLPSDITVARREYAG